MISRSPWNQEILEQIRRKAKPFHCCRNFFSKDILFQKIWSMESGQTGRPAPKAAKPASLTWCQRYKTVYGFKLRLFIISQRVCPWQASPAWSSVCG
jgi:hypothetical protein